ncbi:MAG: T9SS type A sorting domain-containing protein, partial [Flavobacterium sp.]
SKNIEETEINNKINTAVIVYPNPAVDILKIDFTLAEKQDVQVSIYDLNAALLKTIFSKGNQGQNTIDMNVSDLKAGQYLISVRNGDAVVKRSKFIISK